MTMLTQDVVERGAPVATWIGTGGTADCLCRPRTNDELSAVLEEFAGQPVRVLGAGANLLVDDVGVDGLVVDLQHFNTVSMSNGGRNRMILRAGAGVNLPKLITRCVREGLEGIEELAGVPASIGGAVRMNAGGAHGQIADVVHRVEGVRATGERVHLDRNEIDFGYRHSGLDRLIITHVELTLNSVAADQQPALRQRLKDIMAGKKRTQPLASASAGCAFKNPIVEGTRTSAGKLIDEAGCKGMRVGGAIVSDHHANFIVTNDDCLARDVIALMQQIQTRVAEHCGVALEREIIVWSRPSVDEP